jgi:hypothetical protein
MHLIQLVAGFLSPPVPVAEERGRPEELGASADSDDPRGSPRVVEPMSPDKLLREKVYDWEWAPSSQKCNRKLKRLANKAVRRETKLECKSEIAEHHWQRDEDAACLE